MKGYIHVSRNWHWITSITEDNINLLAERKQLIKLGHLKSKKYRFHVEWYVKRGFVEQAVRLGFKVGY